jgi:hypothetical protein
MHHGECFPVSRRRRKGGQGCILGVRFSMFFFSLLLGSADSVLEKCGECWEILFIHALASDLD